MNITKDREYSGLATEFSEETWTANYRGPNEKHFSDTVKRWVKAFLKESAELEKTVGPDARYRTIFDPKKIALKLKKHFLDQSLVPGGRIAANIGLDDRRNTTLMNCFVHHPGDIGKQDPDSLASIYDLLKAQALTLKSEGGIGTNMSYLRPNGSYVKGIASRTPGVVKIAGLWDKSSEIITLGSDKLLGGKRENEKLKIRKGAMMLVLDVWHPEIIDFINAKQTQGILTKFNTSVGITSGFMQAVEDDLEWGFYFPDTEFEKYETEWDGDIDNWVRKGYPLFQYGSIQARELWGIIMNATYTRNEPGVLFLDKANELNALSYKEVLKASNPCGEIIMPTGVCNLAHINLTKFIREDITDEYLFDMSVDPLTKIDFVKYQEAIECGVDFLDIINDISGAPLPEYKESMLSKRRIGLGISGLGSLHFMLGIKYGSKDSLYLTERLMVMKSAVEIERSAKRGARYGSFELFDKEKYFDTVWWRRLDHTKEFKNKIEKIGAMRNSHRSANAPTGNGSIFAGVISGGIEPVFLKEYRRWATVSELDERRLREEGFRFPSVSKGEWYVTGSHVDVHPEMRGDEEILVGTFDGIDYNIDRNRGLTKGTDVEDYGWAWVNERASHKKIFYEKLSESVKAGNYATADDLSVKDHLSVLKVIAAYTDMNSSKTVNLPNSYSYDDFVNLYLEAYKVNIKGLTTYRADTMTAVIEARRSKEPNESSEKLDVLKKVELGDVEHGYRRRVLDSDGVEIYVQMTVKNGKLMEIFANLPNTAGRDSDGKIKPKLYLEKLSLWTLSARLISLLLRSDMPLTEIIKHLKRSTWSEYDFAGVLVPILEEFMEMYDGNGTSINVTNMSLCPECKQAAVILQEGCKVCTSCGWSPCK